MAKIKSCEKCKWLWDFDVYEYTGKCCAIIFKGKPRGYCGTVYEKKDLTPCDMWEANKNGTE